MDIVTPVDAFQRRLEVDFGKVQLEEPVGVHSQAADSVDVHMEQAPPASGESGEESSSDEEKKSRKLSSVYKVGSHDIRGRRHLKTVAVSGDSILKAS